MDTETIDWIARSGAKAKGKRPQYFDDPAQDRMLSILLAVVGEVSVVKQRLDTVERLLDAKGTITRADIENYAPDSDANYERAIMNKEYVARTMRGVQQDMEAIQAIEERSLEEIGDDLKEN